MDHVHIIKIGGAVINDAALLSKCLDDLASLEIPYILVHGGGRHVDTWLGKIGHEVRTNQGRRLTDDTTLELAVMTYAGWINKQIVTGLQTRGTMCLGLSGADLNSIRASKRKVGEVDYGWVGDIEAVNASAYITLLTQTITPICCAITHDYQGQLLNTNADTIASAIAAALAENHTVTLWYTFEKKGVLSDLDDPESVIGEIKLKQYEELKAQSRIHAGMKPKLDNCFDALHKGVKNVHIMAADEIAMIPDSGGTKISLK